MKETIINKAKAVAPILIGLLSTVILIFFNSKNPSQSIWSFFAGTFTSKYYFGTMLNTASLLMIAGTGASMANKSGSLNLGGEGQIYLGGFVAAQVLVNPVLSSNPKLSAVALSTALLSSILAGSCVGVIQASLKEYKKAEILLTSFLLSAAIVPLIDGLITSSKISSNTNMLSLPFIENHLRFRQIMKPSPMNSSFFGSIGICAIFYFLIFKTAGGKKLQVWGTAPEFARYCGFSSMATTFATQMISCSLHSAAGFIAVAGTYYTCHKDFYAGLGWNALTASLISNSNPLALIPTALVLSWIYTSADRISLTQGFSFDIKGIVQAVVLFAIALQQISGREK